VIDGFKIEATAEEIVKHLDDRIRHHRERADSLDAKAAAVEVRASPADDDDEEQLAVCWPGYIMELQRRAARHRRREMFLMFARDRVAPAELYRLSERDLQTLEWLPVEESTPFSA